MSFSLSYLKTASCKHTGTLSFYTVINKIRVHSILYPQDKILLISTEDVLFTQWRQFAFSIFSIEFKNFNFNLYPHDIHPWKLEFQFYIRRISILSISTEDVLFTQWRQFAFSIFSTKLKNLNLTSVAENDVQYSCSVLIKRNKRSALSRQSRDTNRNIKRSVYCQYG